MKFLEIITRILNGEKADEALRKGKCETCDISGNLVSVILSQETLYKLTCLQTLVFEARSVGEIPTMAELEILRQNMPVGGPEATPAELMVMGLRSRSDYWRRITTLEHLMVEVVREDFPAERERLEVYYRVNTRLELLCFPITRPRFLD